MLYFRDDMNHSMWSWWQMHTEGRGRNSIRGMRWCPRCCLQSVKRFHVAVFVWITKRLPRSVRRDYVNWHCDLCAIFTSCLMDWSYFPVCVRFFFWTVQWISKKFGIELNFVGYISFFPVLVQYPLFTCRSNETWYVFLKKLLILSDSFPWIKSSGAWSSPLTSIWYRGQGRRNSTGETSGLGRHILDFSDNYLAVTLMCYAVVWI
jgi:hypothetical protein